MGWAEDQAKEIKEAEERRRKDQEWQMFATAKARSEAPDLFDKLGAQIEADIKEFNATMGHAEVTCSRSQDVIEIVKSAPRPSIYIRMSLRGELPSIEIYKRSTGVDLNALESRSGLGFTVDRDAHVHMGGGSDLVAVSQGVLSEVFGSFRPH